MTALQRVGWGLFAVAYLPATALNVLLWRWVTCEWSRPYGRTDPQPRHRERRRHT